MCLHNGRGERMRGRNKRMFYDDNTNFDDDNVYEKNNYNDTLEEIYEDEDDEVLERDDDIFKVLDPEILEYLNDEKSTPIKKTIKTSSLKKKKKDKIVYEVDEKVRVKGEKCSIIYGPYEVDGKQMYEIETSQGNVISVEDKFIEKLS
jgi:hypothetical protein